MAKSSEQKGSQFNVQFDEKPRDSISYQVVVFDRSKQLVYQSPIRGEKFALPFSTEDLTGKRIFLMPLIDERKTEITLEKAESGAGYEVNLPIQFDPATPVTINPVPKYIWQWWFFCRCHVRGRVFNLCGDQYLPVYKARVHICEVDSIIWYLQKVSDVEVIKLRDEILAKAIHWHLPDPAPDAIQHIDQPVLTRQTFLQTENKQQFAEASSTATQGNALLSSLPKENIASFYSDSAFLVRNYMVQNYKIFYPYWCWIQSLFLTCDEVAVIDTNQSGWFETDIWYFCFGDKPDLYFWVEYYINGVWTTVYHPWIGCNTYWDYTCNTEVDIYLNDSRIPCPGDPTIPGNVVVVTTLGNNANVNRVDQTIGPNQGLAPDLGYGYGNTGPFGGRIEPHVLFGTGLIPSGVHYYRWSYKPHSATDIPVNWSRLNTSVDRHYLHTNPDLSTTFLTYNLGPKSGLANPDLFEIQTQDEPNTHEPWFIFDARTDTATAYFNTNGIDNGNVVTAAGLYDLKLEFFDAAGNQVNLTDLGISLQVPDSAVPAPFGNAIVNNVPVPAANQVLDINGKLLGFKMVIHVDNNSTNALIHETTVGVNTAGPCGMIQYHHKNTDMAHIAFEAFHPNDYAYFVFYINKGSSGTVHEVYGNVSNIPPATIYNRTVPVSPEPYSYNGANDQFDTDKHVGTLLETCDEAAFAEVLNVYATATDGWSRLAYDSSDVKAFALKH